MSDNVTLRPPKSPNLQKFKDRASMIRKSLFDPRRKSKKEMEENGIWKPEPVFGNYLECLPLNESRGVPDFLCLCFERIETMISTEGIYRIPGDATKMQKLRIEINNFDYEKLRTCDDVALLTSTLKMYFREMPQPLISTSFQSLGLQASLDDIRILMDQELTLLEKNLMRALFLHLQKVAADPKNMMNAHNIAMVFGPNLFHVSSEGRRPFSMQTEFESNNSLIETLIENASRLFG